MSQTALLGGPVGELRAVGLFLPPGRLGVGQAGRRGAPGQGVLHVGRLT